MASILFMFGTDAGGQQLSWIHFKWFRAAALAKRVSECSVPMTDFVSRLMAIQHRPETSRGSLQRTTLLIAHFRDSLRRNELSLRGGVRDELLATPWVSEVNQGGSRLLVEAVVRGRVKSH